MIQKNLHVKDSQTERLIRIRISKLKKTVKDKNLLKRFEDTIRKEIEYENSIDGIAENINIEGSYVEEDRRIIAETLLKLPHKDRINTLEEVVFVYMEDLYGLATGFVHTIRVKKDVFEQLREDYITQVEKPLIILNFNRKIARSKKIEIIAHEIAHFILGHYRFINHSRLDKEEEADDLIEKWGFKRRNRHKNVKSSTN